MEFQNSRSKKCHKNAWSGVISPGIPSTTRRWGTWRLALFGAVAVPCVIATDSFWTNYWFLIFSEKKHLIWTRNPVFFGHFFMNSIKRGGIFAMSFLSVLKWCYFCDFFSTWNFENFFHLLIMDRTIKIKIWFCWNKSEILIF